MRKIYFNPLRVYSVDLTSVTTLQSKMISHNSKRKETAAASERGVLVTVVKCMNVAGEFVSSLFVFP